MSQNKLELIKELRQRTNSALGDVKKSFRSYRLQYWSCN